MSLTFNSYGSGQTASLLSCDLLSTSITPNYKSEENLKLYIDGFPSDLTEKGLKTFLKRIGCQFLRVQLFRRQDLTKSKRPFGFIDFDSRKSAQNGLQLIKSQKLFKLFVCFTATQIQLKRKEVLKNQEFEQFSKEINKQNNEMIAEEVIGSELNRLSNETNGRQ